MGRRIGNNAGGIAGAVAVIEEHGGAVEYDLMTRAGMTLDDIPARMPWRAFINFYTHLDAGSAYAAEVSPESAGWQGTARVPALLADIFDAINMLRYETALANTPKRKQKPKKPKPYPRPGVKADEGTRIGRGAIPASKFEEWWGGEAQCQET